MTTQAINTWSAIFIVVITATAGDVLMAAAMRSLGDLDIIRERSGLIGAIRAVVTSPLLIIGIAFMAVSFFSLLYALSWAQVSLVAPATASLTFISNAVAAKFFLHENVDRRRWLAAAFISAGVVLIRH
jgi:drug/metabolite transporter (DMT)-like permease